MRKINTQLIEKKIYEMALQAGVNLTPSCRQALAKARDGEDNPTAKFALETIIDNGEVAVK